MWKKVQSTKLIKEEMDAVSNTYQNESTKKLYQKLYN